jgi:hypothetical protein
MTKYQEKPTFEDLAARKRLQPVQLKLRLGLCSDGDVAEWCEANDVRPPVAPLESPPVEAQESPLQTSFDFDALAPSEEPKDPSEGQEGGKKRKAKAD